MGDAEYAMIEMLKRAVLDYQQRIEGLMEEFTQSIEKNNILQETIEENDVTIALWMDRWTVLRKTINGRWDESPELIRRGFVLNKMEALEND